MPKKTKPKRTTKTNRPVLQPGEHLDFWGTSSTVQNEALKLFYSMRAGKTPEHEGAKILEQLRAAGNVLDEEVKRESAEIEAVRQALRMTKKRR